MNLPHALTVLLVALAALAVGAHDAAACACCTNQGQRRVGVEQLDAGKREEIDRLRFGADAQLFSGEGDPADIKGIAKSSGRYELHVAQKTSRWVFDFRDKAGGSGTLTLAIPAKLSSSRSIRASASARAARARPCTRNGS